MLLALLAVVKPALAASPVSLKAQRLDNGMEVYVREYCGAATVGVALAVKAGVSDEAPGWEGIRQLLELCLVDRARAALAQAAVAIDGDVKLDFVRLQARCLPGLWRRAVAGVLDAVFHVHFDSGLVRAEQALMRRLEGEAEAVPAVVASRLGLAALYPAVERYGRPAAALRGAATVYMEDFYKRLFRVNRAVLTVSGPVEAGQVVRFVGKATEGLLPGPGGPGSGAPAAAVRAGRRRVRVAGEGAAVWVGARMPAPADRQYPAAVVAAAVLGGGMGSRAFRRLRDELSLVYTVGAEVVASERYPYGFVLATCSPADSSRVGDELDGLVDEFVRDGPTADEVTRAREYCAGEAARMAMSNWQAAAFITAMAVVGKQAPWARGPSVLADAIESVTAADVEAVARNWWARRATIEVRGS